MALTVKINAKIFVRSDLSSHRLYSEPHQETILWSGFIMTTPLIITKLKAVFHQLNPLP